MKFVIVDDDVDILRLMGRLLEIRGHDVVLFHAGTSAVIDIPMENPDCVITDFKMVGLDGLDLIRNLRMDANLQNLKIVMVSGEADDETKALAKGAGANGFIGKPIDPKAFADQVESISP